MTKGTTRQRWAWVALVAALVSGGCEHLCKCCGPRERPLPPALRNEGPELPRIPPGATSNTVPASDAKGSGAYGGS